MSAFFPITWLTVEKLTQQGLGMLLFLMLAPILGPKPFGLFAIVMVFIGFCEIVLVTAAVEALVTVPTLDTMHLRTANLCNVVLALTAGTIVFCCADFLAAAFELPGLVPLFRVLALLPIVSSLTVTPIAVLLRKLQFKSLALRSIIGLVVGGVVGFSFAFSEAGVWSLVAQILAQRATELGVLWASAHTRFGMGWSRSHFLDLRGYALSVLISRGMAWFGGQIPRIILGRYLGPGDLGLFVLASRLVESVVQVAIVPRSTVARIKLQEFNGNPVGMANAFEKMVRHTAMLSFPICCGAASIMPTLFVAFLDDRWQSGIAATQLMMLAGVPLTIYYGVSAGLLAARCAHLESQSSTLYNVITGLTVLCAAPFGLTIVCAAIIVQLIVLLPVPLFFLRRGGGFSPFVALRKQVPLLAAAAAMGTSVIWIGPFVTSILGYVAAIPALILIGIVIYGPLASVAAPHEARRLFESLISLVR